jgi:beta-lactamase regulating signal transducer with metallopeptidase domain
MIDWAIETSIAFNLLLLLVLAIRRPITHLGGPALAYALWLLPLVRVLTPPEWLSFGALPSVLPSAAAVAPAAGGTAAPLPPTGGPGQWGPWLLALWVGGAAAFALWHQAAYAVFLRRVRRSAHTSLGVHEGIPVIASAAVGGPVAAGLIRRRIIVPLDFETRYSAEERRLALAHERIHHARGDIWWNLAALGLLALNWFNPLAHWALRAFRADQELSCDAAVLRRAPSGRHDYAQAIVKSASRPGLGAACPLRRGATIKRRLRMMKPRDFGAGRIGASLAAAIGLSAAGLLLSAPGFAEPAPAASEAPIITPAEIKVLRKACGADGDDAGSVTCEKGEIARHPEAKAVMTKVAERTRARVAASLPNKAELAATVAAAAAAARQAASVNVQASVEAAEAAVEASEARIEASRLSAEDMAEAREAIAEARAELREMKLSAPDMAEVNAAIAEAQREIASIDIDAIMAEVDADLDNMLVDVGETE